MGEIENLMGKFEFDTVIPRRGTGSVKWDVPERDGVLPMWVADMDFRTAPAVIEALHRRVEHGIFGYEKAPESCFRAAQGWFERRHGWRLREGSTRYISGVVPALTVLVRALTQRGEGVIIQPPCYNCFFSAVRNNERKLVENPLRLHPEEGRYTMDFDELERLAADDNNKLLILCNPHNPAGRVWTREELLRAGEICLRHGVFVLADEIHCELTRPGIDYTPYATLGEEFERRSVSCVSPSKAFNIAGTQLALIVAADEEVLRRIDRVMEVDESRDINVFGVEAVTAAYSEGAEWLDELREYLNDNYLYLKEYFDKTLPEFRVLPLEGTYLVWVDCRGAGLRGSEAAEYLLEHHDVMVNGGAMYGDDGFVRINIATPRALLKEGLRRIAAGLRELRPLK